MTRTLIHSACATLLLACCSAAALAQPDGDRPRRPDDRGPEARRAEGPRFSPPRDNPGGIDARIARLEQKLDAVLHELRELRRDQHSPRYAERRPGPDREFGPPSGPSRRPMGPPPFARDRDRDSDRDQDRDRNRPAPPRERDRERDRRNDDLSF